MYVCVHVLQSLKTKNCHDANFIIGGDTRGCHNDNLQSHKWPKSWHIYIHWKVRVVMMPTLLSLAGMEVVMMTNPSTASDDKVGIRTTLRFYFLYVTHFCVCAAIWYICHSFHPLNAIAVNKLTNFTNPRMHLRHIPVMFHSEQICVYCLRMG